MYIYQEWEPQIIDPFRKPEKWADSIAFAADLFNKRLVAEHGGFAMTNLIVEEGHDKSGIKIKTRIFPLNPEDIHNPIVAFEIASTFKESMEIAFIGKSGFTIDQIVEEEVEKEDSSAGNKIQLLEIEMEMFKPGYAPFRERKYRQVAEIRMPRNFDQNITFDGFAYGEG
ncbi:hypothetical protein JW978_03835 [Candidatus Dojkabacteria bacterium]|nr:hypothetical protein [Candidatus Dojkabacteria bacterium]